MIIEIAKVSPSARGLFIPKSELPQNIKPDEPLFRSTYLYPDVVNNHLNQYGSIKNYFGERDIDNVIIDIDKKDNSDEYTLDKLKEVIDTLYVEDVEDESMQCFFSGTGYHMIISNEVFGFSASPQLPMVVRATMSKLFPEIDNSIYMRSGIYRVPHTVNAKSGLYKIPITLDEVWKEKADYIKMLAQGQRLEYDYKPLVGNSQFTDKVVKEDTKIYSMQSVAEPNKVVPCIQTMLNNGPEEGNRHNTVLRICSHYKRHGIPSEFTKASLMHWNNGKLHEDEINRLIQNAYDGNYRYSCNDYLMKKHCKTNCIHFKRKDYLIDVKTASELQQDFQERLETNFSGRTIPLSAMLGVEQDVDIYPGELVTVFGPTGSSKTTFAQNIALGVDFANNKVNVDWQIPTLFLSLELSGWYMHRRNLQIVSGLSKDEVNTQYKEVYDYHKEKLSNIVIQTVAPTIQQIQEKIKDLQPAVVIVDYIDLVDVPFAKGEYQNIKYISHTLSNMAVNLDIIIIQVSQVSREYSRNEVLDLYAGKGSGAIENASRKVIGLNGQAGSHLKDLHVFKNTDGELLDYKLEWQPSFRLRRSNV